MQGVKAIKSMNTMNTSIMRNFNAHQVRRRLLSGKSATKASLAADTGLSTMTVGTIITQMEKASEVYALDVVPSNGGRPSVRYIYNRFYALGMIVYGYQKNSRNYFRLKILDMFGDEMVSQEKYIDDVTLEVLELFIDEGIKSAAQIYAGAAGSGKMPQDASAQDYAGIADTGKALRDAAASDYADAAAQIREKIRVIGFGLPGVEQEGRIISNDYPQLIGTDFIAHFSKKYGAEIRFFNDINAAVYGYYDRNRPASGGVDIKIAPAVAGIYYPRLYTPGMGIIIDGRIYAGRQNFAGEIGGLLANAAEPADWLNVDYGDWQQLCRYIARDLYFVCCVLAPERIVLYGDFLQGKEVSEIQKAAETLLKGCFHVELEIAPDFEADFDRGLRALAGDLLYQSVFPEIN